MSKLLKLLIGLTVIACWIAGIAFVASRSDTSRSVRRVNLVEPAPDEVIRLGDDRQVQLFWEIDWPGECVVVMPGGERFAVPESGHHAVHLRDASLRSVTFELACNDITAGRFTRRVALPRSIRTDGRTVVAAGHVDGAELTEVLERELPDILNPILADELRAAGGQIEAQSRNWQLPGWLVDGVRLRSESYARVVGARLSLLDDRFRVELDIDVFLGVSILNRPIIAPSRRGTREIDLDIRDQFRPVRATFSLTEWPELRVRGVELHGRYCSRFDRDVLRNVCNRVVSQVYDKLEEVIREQLVESASGLIESLDLRALMTDAVRSWAEKIELGTTAEALMEGADFDLVDATQDATGVHFTLDANTAWLAESEGLSLVQPEPLHVEDSPSTLDLTVHLALMNRLLHEFFDAPLVDLAERWRPASERYGEGRAIDAISSFFESPDGSAGDGPEATFFRLLSLASVEVNQQARLSPFVSATDDGSLLLQSGRVRLLKSEDTGVFAALSLNISYSLEPQDGEIALKARERSLFDALSIEAERTDSTRAARRAQQRIQAAIAFLYVAMAQQTDSEGSASSLARVDTLFRDATEIPMFTTSFSVGSQPLNLDELSLNHDTQGVVLRLSTVDELRTDSD